MIELVFLLEERSAQVMLEGFLPKILSHSTHCRFIVFDGKQDLEKQLIKRIRGYRVPNARFVVLRDKDSEDCLEIKKRLKAKCVEAGRSDTLIRIACHELESWYLGDLVAVELGLKVSGIARHQSGLYNNPDEIVSPFQKLKTMAPNYQKVGGSRLIGHHLDITNNRSKSFKTLVEGIQKLVA